MKRSASLSKRLRIHQATARAKLIPELKDLSFRGRGSVERRLREVFETGDEQARQDATRFLYMWRDRRAIRVADDWLSKDLDLNTFSNIVACYVRRGGKRAFKRFQALLTESDLPDLYLADVVGQVSELIDTFRRSDTRLCNDAYALLAPFLDHPFPDARWEAVYGLGIHRAMAYRAQIEKLTKDETRTLWRNSTVAHLARAAVKYIDGGDHADFVNSLYPDLRSDAPAIDGKGGG